MPAVLRTTKLPLPASTSEEKAGAETTPAHDADYWTEKTRGFDFSAEDKLDSESFNLILWNGLKGEGQPYPIERDGRDLSKGRAALLHEHKKSKN